jgi:type I restriction enzyme M protein
MAAPVEAYKGGSQRMKRRKRTTPVKSGKSSANKLCRSTDLTNEASVEMFFVSRLLEELGYEDREIRTKKSIQELRIPKGSKTELYKPDYLIVCADKPRWLIDAKSTDERIEDYTYQGAGYALQINRKFAERPLHYYMLTNGLLTRVYVWDQEEAILSLRFGDVVDGNTKFETLKRLLSAQSARAGWQTSEARQYGKPTPQHLLTRPNMDVVKRAFLRCHRIIWKSEKMSPQAAFVEFAKLLFVKLWEDRKLRDNPVLLEMIGKGEALPASEVRFSTRWIGEQEPNDPNPVDALLFRQLVEFLETEIAQRKRKRIFEAGERLSVSPGTAKRVVQQLEHYYLFGIDEDLNGRMFEAFLAATMRGQALGQYFTPRSIVKLITKIAGLHAGRDSVERVLDACCGTGGFLIEALTDMRRQIWDNQSLTKKERTDLLDEVANQAIFGIDAGRNPMVARIARINMYLHGDGGSRVYMTDALRHPPQPSATDSVEIKSEVQELRQELNKGLRFDAALTNPPFSMDYAVTVPEEKEVLETYDLASYGGKKKQSLRSSVMFIERYWQLLRPGGRLITVIDDSVLGGKNYTEVREFIRDKFIIRGIISLHGDAFQRAGARAKTSVLYLTKRGDGEESQPAAFVYESRYIGLDDVVPRTRPSVAEQARTNALAEIEEIALAFDAYMRGREGPWLVPATRLLGRLDAKFLRPWSVSELETKWREVGIHSDVLENLVDPVIEHITLDPEKHYKFLRISYEGQAEYGEDALGREVSYSHVGTTRVGDIIVSNISAVYKAICVIPKGMDGLLVSNEFTVMRLKPGVDADPQYIWSVLRSTAVIAEWLSGASGVGRTRVDWEILRVQKIPLMPPTRQHEIGELYRSAEEHERQITRARQEAQAKLAGLELEGEAALDRLTRAKPPR